MNRLLPLLLIFLTQQVEAFPQLIRHGYTNCNTCHASPRGGGILTDYGRALSKEILSTWGYEGEENWHYGALDNKKVADWLKLGGDYRAVQVHSKDQRATIGRFIEMQEQVEVAGQFNNTWISITGGSDTTKESRPWYIPSYYVSTFVTEKLHLRAGRFVPRFGINMPEHIFSTRGPLGFGFQAERDTLELTYFDEKWDTSLSVTSGELRSKEKASGFYGQANYSFTTRDKVGISLEKKTESFKNFSVGLHGMAGFTEKFYMAGESVWSEKEDATGLKSDGLYHFLKLGYELEKGFHIIAIEDFRKTDLSKDSSSQFLYGAGFAFFPRPHFEFQGILAKRKNLSFSNEYGDYGWLLMHFYL